jgi:hypothetical protein
MGRGEKDDTGQKLAGASFEELYSLFELVWTTSTL